MPRLNDTTIGYYQIAARNISTAFIPYYKTAASSWSDTKSGVGKIIKEQQVRMSEAMGLLGRTMGRGTTLITRKELKTLDRLLDEIKKVHGQ